MTENDVKKALYKQAPKANFLMMRKAVAHYSAELEDGTKVRFEIPVEDMGDADFLLEMEAKLLIRYLKIDNETT